MLNYFYPFDYYHPVDPYEAYIREQEARRLSERRRRLQLQRQQHPTIAGFGGRFPSPSYYDDDDVVEAPYLEDDYGYDGSAERLVRGRDGRIYRVPVKRMNPSMSAQTTKPPKPLYTLVRGPNGRLYRVPITENDRDANETENDSLHRTQRALRNPKPTLPKFAKQPFEEEPESAAAEASIESPQVKPRSTKKSNKKRVTVIVEDASDSEDDDEARQSVWRNRLPSPGQWMEPVETLYEL